MGKNDVHLVMTAAEGQMVQAWMNARQSVGAFANEVQKVGKEGKKSSDEMQKGFKNAIKEIRRGFLSLFGVQGVQSMVRKFAELVKKEFRAVREEGDKAFTTQKGLGQMLRQIEFLQPADSDIKTEEIAELVRTQSRGVPLRDMAGLVSTAITAGVGPDVRRRATVPIQLADFVSAFDQQTREAMIQQFVASMQQLPGTSARGQAAVFTQALSASPAGGGQAMEFAQNVFATATQSVARGFTQEEALSNIIALQIRSQDVTGRTSATNFITLVEDLQTRLKAAGVDKRGQGALDFIRSNDPRAQQISRELLGATRLQAGRDLQAADTTDDPVERAELRARARGRFALTELLQPQITTTQRLFTMTMQQVKTGQEALNEFEKKQRRTNEMVAVLPENLDRLLNQFAQSIRGTGVTGLRERLRKFLEDESVLVGDLKLKGEVSSILEQLRPTAGKTDAQVTADVLEQIQSLASSRIQERRAAIFGDFGDMMREGRVVGGETREEFQQRMRDAQRRVEEDPVIQASQQLLEGVKVLSEDIRGNTEATKGNTEVTNQRGDIAPIEPIAAGNPPIRED